MERETGGPAFPVPIAGDTAGFVDAEECGVATGLTIRDYFAAKAMAGDWGAVQISSTIEDESLIRCAQLYYRMADAMLKVRSPDHVDIKPASSWSDVSEPMPY